MDSRMLVATILIAGSIHAAPALACSCGRVGGADALMARAAAIFTGVAERTRSIGPNRSLTTFRVVEAFKGVRNGARVDVEHRSGHPASCGVTFEIGATHTLAAYRDEPRAPLGASSCSTWMFNPNVGSSGQLIRDLRALSRRR